MAFDEKSDISSNNYTTIKSKYYDDSIRSKNVEDACRHSRQCTRCLNYFCVNKMMECQGCFEVSYCFACSNNLDIYGRFGPITYFCKCCRGCKREEEKCTSCKKFHYKLLNYRSNCENFPTTCIKCLNRSKKKEHLEKVRKQNIYLSNLLRQLYLLK